MIAHGRQRTVCVAYVYAPDRKGRAADYPPCRASKVLQVDVYGSRRMLAERGDMHLAFYLSHVPAASTKSLSAGPALIASEALKRIAGPCAIESDAIGALPRSGLLSARTGAGRPLRAKLVLISQKTKLAEAIRYALSRWEG